MQGLPLAGVSILLDICLSAKPYRCVEVRTVLAPAYPVVPAPRRPTVPSLASAPPRVIRAETKHDKENTNVERATQNEAEPGSNFRSVCLCDHL